eukprot:CAMPEP_0181381912 /NCGR_PEP_ID=MMETSP1106-20121128/20409_1 /TAXON_ID=81844 /ORGANISM="Mantoniella antarctica, Strain SL-175" /LENGTH=168 /DNA_ID=CAMNT_0023501197 /DNA_START=35 /DNA_END=538 /DNA_ORIENTATION=+
MTPPPSDTPAPRRSTRGAAPPRGEDERVTADAKNLNDGRRRGDNAPRSLRKRDTAGGDGGGGSSLVSEDIGGHSLDSERQLVASQPTSSATPRTRSRRRGAITHDPRQADEGEVDEDEGEAGDAQDAAVDDEPDELLCPVLRVMLRDPVFVAGSGNTYERAAIERFWA